MSSTHTRSHQSSLAPDLGHFALGVVAIAGIVSLAACQPAVAPTPPAPTPVPVGVSVQPSQKLQSLAQTPPKKAKKRGSATAIGKGETRVSTKNSRKDADVTWVEAIDIDGNGTVESALLLWDNEDKVLFVATRDAVSCRAGGGMNKTGLEQKEVLIAVFGEGNRHGRPPGSGWWVAALGEGQCLAKAAGIYGCEFDAQGQATVCGAVVIDEKNDSITVVSQTMP